MIIQSTHTAMLEIDKVIHPNDPIEVQSPSVVMCGIVNCVSQLTPYSSTSGFSP